MAKNNNKGCPKETDQEEFDTELDWKKKRKKVMKATVCSPRLVDW
jgi:hypothetical protein